MLKSTDGQFGQLFAPVNYFPGYIFAFSIKRDLNGWVLLDQATDCFASPITQQNCAPLSV